MKTLDFCLFLKFFQLSLPYLNTDTLHIWSKYLDLKDSLWFICNWADKIEKLKFLWDFHDYFLQYDYDLMKGLVFYFITCLSCGVVVTCITIRLTRCIFFSIQYVHFLFCYLCDRIIIVIAIWWFCWFMFKRDKLIETFGLLLSSGLNRIHIVIVLYIQT